MMRKTRILTWRRPHRSMFGQMMIVTIAFIGLGIYVFAIQPLMRIPAPLAVPPLLATAQGVNDALRAFLFERRDGMVRAGSPDDLPVIRQVRAVNPDFRLFVRNGAHRYGDEVEARFFRPMGFDRLTEVLATTRAENLCAQVEKPIEEPRGLANYSYFHCGSVQYYEFSGLRTPVAAAAPPVAAGYVRWVWRYSGGFLYATIGIFLVYAAILLLNMRMIRRVADLARSFDPEQVHQQLPERGLPVEILPLVRATNHMLGRLNDAQKRRQLFFSAAAHEMRTPLTILRTRMELLDDGPVKDKLTDDVRRLVMLVNRLLTLMQIDGHGALDGIVDIVTTSRAVTAAHDELARRRQVALRFLTDVDGFEVLGDDSLVGTAITNLIGNAIAFAPADSEVLVTVDAAGCVSVRDHGCGLPDDTIGTLFEPFVRLSQERQGFGLGLAIVKAVTDLHGGSADAANAAGGGALFTACFGERIVPTD